jgi:hypothetical protein
MGWPIDRDRREPSAARPLRRAAEAAALMQSRNDADALRGMLRKRLKVKVLGSAADIEADIELSNHITRGCSARVTATWHGEQIAHETDWFEHERDVLAAAATWLRSHLGASTTCLVAISGAKRAA